jgi:hypothetical protein
MYNTKFPISNFQFPISKCSIHILYLFWHCRVEPEYVSCQLIDIPGKYDFKPYSFGFQKNSPYLGLFDFYLNQLKEKGTMQQIIQEYVAKTPECPDYSGNPLGMSY